MRRHLYLAWSITKAILAVGISPVILLTFLASKPAFIALMSALWPHLDIYTPEGLLYLRRWFMTPKTQLYHPRFLHLILLPDEGRDPHNHPGAFSTTILWNGYDEEIYFPKDTSKLWWGRPARPWVREVRAWNTYDNPEGHTHLVKLIGPTLSWVVAWKRGKPWGFWKLDALDPARDVWVESNEYGDKGVERKSWTIDGK